MADVKPKRSKSRQPANAKNEPVQTAAASSFSPRRRWCFRLLALLTPLVALALLELGLRLVGYGYPTHFFLLDRLNGEKIAHDNQQFGWRFFPPSIARTPRPVVFSPVKPPQTCRVFVFGESAAFGDPSPAFGLPRVLEVLLRNRYPGVHFEIVNASMTAINSNVILPIARDCAREEGDVWVVYMGNNEVVGPYGGGTVFGPQAPSLPAIRASIWFNSTKIGQLLTSFRQALAQKKSGAPANVSLELFLNHKLRHDDPQMEKVYSHFARNLADILKTGTQSGARLVVSTVAVNLKDCAPFASLHRPDLTDTQKAEWDRLYQVGVDAEQAKNFSDALEAYSQAARIDDQFADLHFRKARLLSLSNNFADSLQHFILARDYDALRFRADTRINDIIRQTCTNRLNEGIAFLDGNNVLAQSSPHGIPDDVLFYEHVHLNFSGNYSLARGFAEQIAGVLKPAALKGQAPARNDWLPAEECAAQLGLNDWDRCQTLEIVRKRLASPPFTLQLNHDEQFARVQNELAQFLSALSPQTLALCVQRNQQALALNSKDWVLHQKFAQLLETSPDKSQQTRALDEWWQVTALMPHFADAHCELGILLDRAGQTSQAEAELRTALTLASNYSPTALNAMGHVLASENRLSEAVDLYEKAIRLKPNFADAHSNLGAALEKLGKKDEARTHFEEAMRLGPANTQTASHLGELFDEHGEVSAAVTRYTEMLRADPNNAITHFKLGRCMALLGRSADAQEHYAEALRLQPDFAEAHSELGVELGKSGKVSEALDHFRKAVALKADSEEFHKNLGIALARQHEFVEAATEFEAALRLNPNDAATQRLLQAARRSRADATH
jgi:Flp pilus assembly protein TadD